MKILTFSTLYPDSTRPGHGIFVETRLKYLLQSGQVEVKVVAPVPWFPTSNPRFGSYATFANVPRNEIWNDVEVIHPRYPLIPKVGMTLAPWLMAQWVKSCVKEIKQQGYDFDVIDAHYFYPDGVAAAMLGASLNKPVVITARGTDLNLIPQYALPRKMIQWAAKRSSALITVCQALKDVLIDMGTSEEKITVLRNGVNLDLFSPPQHREQLRQSLNIDGKTILSVGYLITRKGHDLVIKALSELPDITLLIAGDGPEKANLMQLAEQCQVSDRVKFLGALEQSQLKDYYGAADALILASSREGWANVLLESMACGTPVVATRVWGTPEVVTIPESGVLIRERTASDTAFAIKTLFKNYPDRSRTRLYAEKFSWDETTQGQIDIFRKIVSSRA